ncbi:molybdopterin-binding protein [Desulforhopalus sp. IMCC35007]|uniref:competence/damage-inducible protein A n=1 Tax=Desulforhopalus sp. IMCC35007 TaxID=2569543 RepID=UPI0010AEC899|nr:competence/damage-inducible protein A [Desulforhopalus sp. IMCC35007]TKB06680.1 competence/damage-inducible protein A [Desulforhopalus sp. IMCC35007]
MKKAAKVEIIIVGNEILTGDILDTNTNWLCKLIYGRGGSVTRVTVIPDELEVVADAVRQSVARKIDILFTSGGLGPTSDDLTLEAVALGTNRETVLHEEALELVRQQYDHFFERGIMKQGGLNPARQKMACLPLGGEPLVNPVGTAPGVLLRVDKTTIISVPGVPSELKGIIEQSLQTFLNEVFGDGEAMSRCVGVMCNDESQLEPVLVQIVEKYPEIYTKSLATTLGENPEMNIIMTISGIGEKQPLLDTAFEELCNGLTGLGFPITLK